jgi:hypothetical protein
VLVVEDVLEVHDLACVAADGKHRDLVQDLHGAVDAVADAGRELGGVLDPRLLVGALAHGGKQATERKRIFF